MLSIIYPPPEIVKPSKKTRFVKISAPDDSDYEEEDVPVVRKFIRRRKAVNIVNEDIQKLKDSTEDEDDEPDESFIHRDKSEAEIVMERETLKYYYDLMNENPDEYRRMDSIYHSRYVIFKDQTVLNIQTRHIIKPYINIEGYVKVCIYNDALWKWHHVMIHNLMGKIYLDPPDDPELYSTIDHWNRNKLDNSIGNLKWATKRQQVLNRRDFNKTCKVVVQYDIYGDVVDVWDSVYDIVFSYNKHVIKYSNDFRNKADNIYRSIRNKTLLLNSYWKYYEYQDQDDEVWKIINFEGKYKVTVSNYGNIKRKDDYVTKGWAHKGYFHIQLRHNDTGKYAHKRVNMIVDEAFPNGELLPGMVVDHGDENKLNNMASNLKPLTRSDNSKKSAREKAIRLRGTDDDRGVYRLDLEGYIPDDGEEYDFDSAAIAAEKTGICASNIASVYHHIDGCYTAGKYLWIKRKHCNPRNIKYLVDRYNEYANKHKIYRFNLDGSDRRCYMNMVDGGLSIKESDTSSIKSALSGKYLHAYGYLWIRYLEYTDDILQERIDNYIEHGRAVPEICTKGLYRISLDGSKSVWFPNVHTAKVETHITGSCHISAVLKGERYTSNKHLWVKYEDYSEEQITYLLSKVSEKRKNDKCDCCYDSE